MINNLNREIISKSEETTALHKECMQLRSQVVESNKKILEDISIIADSLLLSNHEVCIIWWYDS